MSVAVRSSTIPVYVNKRSRVGHIDRFCEYLAGVPDGALYVQRLFDQEPVRRRMCRHCSPVFLRPSLDCPDAGLTAVLHDQGPLSIAEGERS